MLMRPLQQASDAAPRCIDRKESRYGETCILRSQGSQDGQPQVAVLQPVLDRTVDLQFVISGAINLKERNLLGELANLKFGTTGYMFILTTDGVVVEHPQKSRILDQFNSEGEDDTETDEASVSQTLAGTVDPCARPFQTSPPALSPSSGGTSFSS